MKGLTQAARQPAQLVDAALKAAADATVEAIIEATTAS
jgi:hypothetical protein